MRQGEADRERAGGGGQWGRVARVVVHRLARHTVVRVRRSLACRSTAGGRAARLKLFAVPPSSVLPSRRACRCREPQTAGGWVPRGTHDWRKFLKPSELARPLRAAGLAIERVEGVSYQPLTDDWRLSSDATMNYMLAAARSL